AIGPFLVERRPPDAVADTAAKAGPVGWDASKPNDATLFAQAIASGLPSLTVKARDDIAKQYAGRKGHKALAFVPRTTSVWHTGDWPSSEAAEVGALERCQLYYNTPCAVLLVNDTVQTASADGTWPLRDMERIRYGGLFDPSRIPAIGD